MKKYIRSDEGATSIEYGVLLGGIAMAMVAGIMMFSAEFVEMQDVLSTYLTSRL